MKKKLRFICGFLFAFFALISASFYSAKPQASTNAAGTAPFTITLNTNGGFCSVTTLETDENGYIPVTTTIPDAYHSVSIFMGWYTSTTATEPVTHDTQFTGDTTLIARWASKTYSYVVSKNSEKYEIFGATFPSGYDYSLTDGENITSINTALELINNDGYGEQITITFNNIELTASEPTIDLTIPRLTVSGTISSQQAHPILQVTPSADNSTLNLKNLTLTNDSCNSLVVTSLTEYVSTLSIEDCVFSSTSMNHHAITIASTKYKFEILGNNVQNCDYLFNYIKDMDIDLSTELTNSVDNPLYASIDYKAYNQLITNDFAISNDGKIIFTCNPEPINIVQYIKGSSLLATSTIDINFDLNGGSYNGNFEDVYYYATETQAYFPSSSDISRPYSSFRGWFGKLTLTEEQKNTYNLDSTVWYFDIPSLQAFYEENYDLAKISECLTSNEDDLLTFTTQNAFAYYLYDNEKSNPESYLPIDLAFHFNVTLEFIASWDVNKYTITFNSNEGSSVDSITLEYNDTIPTLQTPTKDGYSFGGWFTDSSFTTEFNSQTMPAENLTLYAKWNELSYTVTFKTNNGTNDVTQTYEFGEEIDFPSTLTVTGHYLEGWYKESTFTNKFSSLTMPNENLTLYAKWEKQTYYLYYNVNNVGSSISALQIKYGDNIPALTTPSQEGYVFDGWFADTSLKTPFSTKTMPAQNIMVHAKWRINEYTITCITYSSPAQIQITEDYGTEITGIYEPIKKGYSFKGWFTEETFVNKYTFSTMPAANLTLYAKWEEKLIISIDSTTQKVKAESNDSYIVESNLNGFSVQYLVDGSWQTEVPTKVGSYDIKLYRAEDEYYTEFESIIKDAFVVEALPLELNWLIILLYAVFVIELIVVFVIKAVKKIKRTQSITLAISLPFGLISTSDFVLTIVGAVLVLFGFILIIYELVKLHKTQPIEDEKTSKYDTRAMMESRVDNSENEQIKNNVDNLLKNQGFVTKDEYSKDDEYVVEENIIERAEKQYNPNIKSENDDNEK